jgi:hypothetical protein
MYGDSGVYGVHVSGVGKVGASRDLRESGTSCDIRSTQHHFESHDHLHRTSTNTIYVGAFGSVQSTCFGGGKGGCFEGSPEVGDFMCQRRNIVLRISSKKN